MQPENVAEQPVSPVPWSAAEIVVLLVLGMFCPTLVHSLLGATGLYEWVYGPEAKQLIAAGGPAGQLQLNRERLWAAGPAQLVLVVLGVAVLRAGCGATLAQLGLTLRNAGRNAAAGLGFVGVFAPGALALNWLAIAGMRQLGGVDEKHAFTQLGQAGLMPVEWWLLVAAAVVSAPLWEEFLYRGVVQPWVMATGPRGGWFALGLALVLTVLGRQDFYQAAWAAGGAKLAVEVIPVAALVLLMGVYAMMVRRGVSDEAAGLFATAVLFGWIHARVWPSPVALVWLAVGLGWLAWRGKSLVGCVVLHAVFNAIACAMLLYPPRP